MLQKIRKMIKRDKGFTLIELMVVVAILGILAAIAIPRFVDNRDDAEDAMNAANIKILQNAVDMYYFEEGDYPANLNALITAGYIKESESGNLSDYTGYSTGEIE